MFSLSVSAILRAVIEPFLHILNETGNRLKRHPQVSGKQISKLLLSLEFLPTSRHIPAVSIYSSVFLLDIIRLLQLRPRPGRLALWEIRSGKKKQWPLSGDFPMRDTHKHTHTYGITVANVGPSHARTILR